MPAAAQPNIRRVRLPSAALPALTTRIAEIPPLLQGEFAACQPFDTSLIVLSLDLSTDAAPPRATLDRLHTLGLACRFRAESANIRIAVDAADLLAVTGVDSILDLIDRVNSPAWGWALRLSTRSTLDPSTPDTLRRLDHRLAACLLETAPGESVPPSIAAALREAGYDGPVIPADPREPAARP